MTDNARKINYKKEILQWVEAIIIAVVISMLIRGFVFETVLVDGPSMEKTLSSGDRLILFKAGYYFSPPKRGDIVVLQVHEGTLSFMPLLEKLPIFKKAIPDLTEIDYIKRGIGVPGDTIEFKDGFVYVNGERLVEPYVQGLTYGMERPIKVEENKVFVMGDNRLDSRDSRDIGLIDYDRIRGKAILRIWPLKAFGSIY